MNKHDCLLYLKFIGSELKLHNFHFNKFSINSSKNRQKWRIFVDLKFRQRPLCWGILTKGASGFRTKMVLAN